MRYASYRLIVAAAFLSVAAIAHAQTTQPTEREITFSGAQDVKLAGSLMLPAGASSTSKVPAILLVPGSGPTDRDGNQLPILRTDLLKQLATALAHAGLATFRFDKRVVGDAARSMPMDVAGLGEYVRWEHFVGDTAAAYQAMRQQLEIDPARTGMLGHSEGGMLELAALDELKGADAPRALVLIGTPARSIDLVIVEQVNSLLMRQGATPQQAKYFIDETNRIIQTIRSTGQIPADVPPGLAALFPSYIGKFFQSELKVDPLQLAAHFSGPVLIVNGENDIQVSIERDARALDTTLNARAGDDHQLLIVDGASHNLKPVRDKLAPGFTGDVPAEAMKAIVSWTAGKLGG